MGLVGEDEAAGVADKLQDTADRYAALVEASDNLGQLLQSSKAGLRHLVLTYQDLQVGLVTIQGLQMLKKKWKPRILGTELRWFHLEPPPNSLNLEMRISLKKLELALEI